MSWNVKICICICIFIYSHVYVLSLSRYIQALANNVSFVRYKDIYAAAAEIIGLMLKNLSQKIQMTDDDVWAFCIQLIIFAA